MSVWAWAFVLVGVFCLARAVFDVREKRYVWAGLGLAAGLAVLLTPMPAQTVKIDLPTEAAH